MRLSEAGASFGVMHEGPDAEFHAVGTDSRAVTGSCSSEDRGLAESGVKRLADDVGGLR